MHMRDSLIQSGALCMVEVCNRIRKCSCKDTGGAGGVRVGKSPKSHLQHAQISQSGEIGLGDFSQVVGVQIPERENGE